MIFAIMNKPAAISAQSPELSPLFMPELEPLPRVPPTLEDAYAADSPAERKVLMDLYMRKHYPGLWRSRNEKSSQQEMEADSKVGVPRMVQQERARVARKEWIDQELPLVENRLTSGKSKRAAGCNRTDVVFPPPECGDRYFDQYKDLKAEFAPQLAYDLIGGGDPQCTCIKQLPEFIVCSDQYLGYTFYDPFDWPKQFLDYRNVTALWDENGIGGSCTRWWSNECPEPATTHDDIMLQIDETLKQSPGTRTYLNQSLLDAYLDWRKANGAADGFQYILVADKVPTAPAAGTPGALRYGNVAFWSLLGLGALGLIGAGIWTKIKIMKYKAAIRNIVASTSAPPHSAPTVRVASPSSMGSVSTTVPHLRNPKQPASTAGNPVGTADAVASSSSSSDDSSHAGMSAVVIDIDDTAPAGHEDD